MPQPLALAPAATLLLLLLLAPPRAAATSASSSSSTSKLYPGRCSSVDDCATYGSNYACVAVTSDVAGLELLNMCIPGDEVCSGSIAGLCPTFSSWPSKYRVIQPVCAFVEVENCNVKHSVTVTSGSGSEASAVSVGDATAEAAAFFLSDAAAASSSGSGSGSSASASGDGTVECYSATFSADDESVVVNGIYQCVDYATFLSSNGGHLAALTEALADDCGYNSTSQALCGGQGTCAPETSFSSAYACQCNAGYASTEFCDAEATSNTCSTVSQCGTMGSCVSGACVCDDGATGNQCALCDPTSAAACSGHGDCSSDGVCTCASGYSGDFCGEKAAASASASDASSASSSSTDSAKSATTENNGGASHRAEPLAAATAAAAVSLAALLLAAA